MTPEKFAISGSLRNFPAHQIWIRSLVTILGTLICGSVITWYFVGYRFFLQNIITSTVLFTDLGVIIAVLVYIYKLGRKN
jgi:predicted membrane protein